MLGLPPSTEVKRPLPKVQLYKKFELKQSQRDAIDADIARMDFVNLIAPQTLPAISEGTEVKAIFVVDVELKRKNYDVKTIGLIARLIPQRIVFALRFEDKVQLAVYHTKLFLDAWQHAEGMSLRLEGLNLDAVWENIVSSIGQFSIENDKSLEEQIKIEEERQKNLRQIAFLEKELKSTSQTRRQRELYLKIKKLKSS